MFEKADDNEQPAEQGEKYVTDVDESQTGLNTEEQWQS